jgi:prevent-host-death family protein
MLNLARDIHSLSDFKRKTPEFIERLEETGEPVVLTVNGRARLVVQDAASYQRMLELVRQAETIEAIREGLEAVAAVVALQVCHRGIFTIARETRHRH